MGIFKKLFRNKKQASTESQDEERSKYMPSEKIPIDELFTINFMKNGGKFIYCDSYEEINQNFSNILVENNWNNSNVLCFNDELKNKFKTFNLKFENQNPSFFFTTCESLIADKGSILISSNQIKENKVDSLPESFVLFATTSQLKETISEGLRSIKDQNKNQIPSNITTLKHFKHTLEEKDFMTYGSSTKNLYLLLLEDL
ncbi:LUD domain-containing protein [Pseudofulvibacter geojedonensis]|uniref:LUD domain-containing protein n=1 Tax=Pseudofulvibacter geojedonensis TaxID=1123758 RepID=A0ABW3I515_9FLAO